MEIQDPLSFAGNALALVAVGGKTLHDLVLNPRRFQRDLDKLGDLEAAKRKRDRTDASTALTFLLLALSYALMILATVQL
jgi:hypothetical protein